MKYLTYFLTFFAYTAVHNLRMTYSTVKPSLQETFQLSSVFMGLFDGLIYISLGIGYFLRYFTEGHIKKTTIYFTCGIITACSYSVIPIIGLILSGSDGTIGDQPFTIRYLIPGIALILFGFGQFSSWPILLYFVSHQFSVKKESTLIGIWSANGDFGNIIGFLLSNLLLKTLNMRWQYVMITGSVIYAIFAFAVLLALRDNNDYVKPDETQQLSSKDLTNKNEEQQISRKQKFFEFLSFTKQIVSRTENKLFLIAFALLKAILYGFLLWMPTYLTHAGDSDIATYAPSLFNLCTVIGSAVLGYFYKQRPTLKDDQYQQLSSTEKCFHKLIKNLRSYSLFYSGLVICGGFIIFFTMQVNILFTLILSGVIGFFLGASFNMLAANEILSITQGDQSKTQMLSTLSMAIGNVCVGIVEIVIGLALNVGKDYSKQTNLFIVLLVISSLATLVILIRSTLLYQHRRQVSRLYKINQNMVSQQL